MAVLGALRLIVAWSFLWSPRAEVDGAVDDAAPAGVAAAALKLSPS